METAFDGCQCGDPRNRRYLYQDWDKTPARLYWTCQGCDDVGVLFVEHDKMPAGYNEPRLIHRATISQLVRWEAIDFAKKRRSSSWPSARDVAVSEHELTTALREEQKRLRGMRQREAEAEAVRRDAAIEEANRERDRYRALSARLMAWHDGKTARRQFPKPTMDVLIGGGEAAVVYALVDPADPERVRYVGKTMNPLGRYRDHCKFNPWALALVNEGRAPTMLAIEWAPTNEDALERERFWINHYRALGMADVNVAIPREEAA